MASCSSWNGDASGLVYCRIWRSYGAHDAWLPRNAHHARCGSRSCGGYACCLHAYASRTHRFDRNRICLADRTCRSWSTYRRDGHHNGHQISYRDGDHGDPHIECRHDPRVDCHDAHRHARTDNRDVRPRGCSCRRGVPHGCGSSCWPCRRACAATCHRQRTHRRRSRTETRSR